MNVELSPTMYQ